jgi:hypothetical protein
MREITNPFDSLFTTIVCDSRDWASNHKDAWLWGIIVGWDNKSLEELQNKFNWTDTTCDRLKSLHRDFEIAQKIYLECSECE